MAIRVLHIGKYFPPYAGGMETYLRDLMAAQAKQGIDTAALVHQSDISINSQDELQAIGETRLSVTRAAVWARFVFTPISPTFGWLLHRLIKKRTPDILHFHMPNVSVFWALMLPAARKIPWVVHWHADVLASQHSLGLRLFYALYRPFERAILRHCDAIIVTSPPYLAASEPLVKFRDKCHTIPLGLTTPPVQRVVKTAAANGDTLRVLAIGRLTYYKGFEYLLRAAAQCPSADIHLVGKGHQERHLRSLARELKIEHRVSFHGHLSDTELDEQFSACDCLCLPSIERSEAFGMVLLEAMSRGVATLISKVPGSGMAWVVDDGVTGLHVPPENADKLAAAMRHLAQDRDKMHRLGTAGREKFDRQFHIDQSAAGVSELYTRLPKIVPENQQRANT